MKHSVHNTTVSIWHNGCLLTPDDYTVVLFNTPFMKIQLEFPCRDRDVVQVIDSRFPGTRHVFKIDQNGTNTLTIMPEEIVDVMES